MCSAEEYSAVSAGCAISSKSRAETFGCDKAALSGRTQGIFKLQLYSANLLQYTDLRSMLLGNR